MVLDTILEGTKRYWRRYFFAGLLLHPYMLWQTATVIIPNRNLSWWSPGGVLKVGYSIAEKVTPEFLEGSHSRLGPWLYTPSLFGKYLGADPTQTEARREQLEQLLDDELKGRTVSTSDQHTLAMKEDLDYIPEPLRSRGNPGNLFYAGLALLAAERYKKKHCRHRTTDL